jgi:hypothetical protein
LTNKTVAPLHDGTNKGQLLLVWAVLAPRFAPPFMFSGIAVALPAMGTDLNAGATSLRLVETVFLASQLALLLPVGRFVDTTGRASDFGGSHLRSWLPCSTILPWHVHVSDHMFINSGWWCRGSAR